jgi:hypothetical protein
MEKFFDAKFYQDAMSSAFSCQLARRGNDVPKKSKRTVGAARPCALKILSDNQNKDCCQAGGKHVDPEQKLQVHETILHYAAKSSYVPQPLHGWTVDEQLSLIAASRRVQSERSLMIQHCGWTEEMAHQKHLQLISEQMQSRSAQECECCLNQLRVAYFGH